MKKRTIATLGLDFSFMRSVSTMFTREKNQIQYLQQKRKAIDCHQQMRYIMAKEKTQAEQIVIKITDEGWLLHGIIITGTTDATSEELILRIQSSAARSGVVSKAGDGYHQTRTLSLLAIPGY